MGTGLHTDIRGDGEGDAPGRRKLRTILLEVLGAVLLALGFVGVFLPVVPTTPFVLAAAFCFSSNPRVYGKIRDSPYFGEYLRAYREGTGVSMRTRVTAVAFVWVFMAIGIIAMDQTWTRALLVVVGVCVTVHLALVGRRGKG